jgi:hypothetical protein
MRIAICGSFTFAKEMILASEKLTEMGHIPILPSDVAVALKNPAINRDIDWCIQKDVIRDQLTEIISSDAILVLNYTKDNIQGYIGGSTLIELGFAYYYKKKIFLLYPIPKLSYGIEIAVMHPTILEGDITRIKALF